MIRSWSAWVAAVVILWCLFAYGWHLWGVLQAWLEGRSRRRSDPTEYQRIALGYGPRTLGGVWFWVRYWSPPARWWRTYRAR